MKIGIGLPIGLPPLLLDWAARADAGPFHTIGLLDRLVYANPEPLVTLSVLAGATSRVRLQTEVLIAPVREPVLLAKQVATLDLMSGGRFTLGLGIGGRADDYLATGVDLRRRGAVLDEQLTTMRALWSGEPLSAEVGPIGPAPVRPGGPELLFGAFAPAALDRVGRWGGGFLCAAPIEHAEHQFDAVRRSWTEHGRSGEPRVVAQVNVALGGPDVLDAARANILAYYGSPGLGERMAARVIGSPSVLAGTIRAFAELGADEMMCYCWATDPDQVHHLTDALR